MTVRYSEDDGWWVVKAKAFTPVSVRRKADAVRLGMDAAKVNEPSLLVVFKRNGDVQLKRHYPPEAKG